MVEETGCFAVWGCFSASLYWWSSSQCCEGSCCTPTRLATEHLTTREGLTFNWFSSVSFTLAFNLFYSSWHTAAAVKPGWKKKKKIKKTQSVRQCMVVSQLLSQFHEAGWNAKSLCSAGAHLLRPRWGQGRGDGHCFHGASGAAVLDQK